MNQLQLVGFFFFIGILLGSLLSFYFVARDYGTTYVGASKSDTMMTTSARRQNESSVNDVMLEVRRLQRIIRQLNATFVNNTKVVYVAKAPTTHEELDAIKSSTRNVAFKDRHLHAGRSNSSGEFRNKCVFYI